MKQLILSRIDIKFSNLAKQFSLMFDNFRRRKLLFELNATGKYFAFKEQLKNSVVKIVREKFLKTNLLEDKDQMQVFMN